MNQQIQYIPLQHLQVSKLNVRKNHIDQELGVLMASVKAQGILVPLIVRRVEANGEDQYFEILAGQRRYRACLELAKEGVDEPLPCVVVAPGDDAHALDISLAENLTQLPMNPLAQYEAFAALLKLKMPLADIAARYGVTERIVQQRLAMAALIPALKQEIQKSDIGLQEIQILTMATASQQREWLALYREQPYQAPRGSSLRAWVCGGGAIETGVALFPLEQYQGSLVTDLFGDKTYFSDNAAFWALQTAAIEQKKAELEKSGWSKVILWQTNQYFSHWHYEPLTKAKGGWVFILSNANGEVEILKGLIPRAVLEKAQAAAQKEGVEQSKAHLVDATTNTQDATKQRRGELTAALIDYMDLHKQAAVRLHLTQQPGLALRVAVAALISGLPTWAVQRDAPLTVGDAILKSVRESAAQQAYEQQRRDAYHWLVPLDEPDDEPTFIHRYGSKPPLAEVLARLIALPDEEVFQLLAILTAETLPAGSGLIDVLGQSLHIDMRHYWRLEDTFLSLLIDKETLTGMVKELGGPTGKNLKCAELRAMIQHRVNGQGCKAVEDWLPGYLEFPPRGYTDRFNAPAVEEYKRMASALGLVTLETVDSAEGAAATDPPEAEAETHFDEALDEAA